MSSVANALSFPARILRGPDALSRLRAQIQPLGQRVFVIGGKQALAAAMPSLQVQLPVLAPGAAGVGIIEQAWYGGEVTEANIERLTRRAGELAAQVILAVGGGKALDTAKVVAEQTRLPVVTLPTLAATCAAVSAVSVLYDEQGHYQGLYGLQRAPELVILDPALIARAPLRWLSAGLGDTLAKFYEFRAIRSGVPDCSLNMAAYVQGQLCHEVIARYGAEACELVRRGATGFALEQVIDAIFVYAGFTSIMGVGDHVAAAHALYDGFTVLEKTRHFGHGLLVGFGNLCLLALEGRDDAELLTAIALARECGVPVCLAQIAVLDQGELRQVAEAACGTPDMANMPFRVSADTLVAAMVRVSRLAQS
ncbi:iron-containing alcohol dehydrogenase family protein [Pseudaeromonas sp. ZJS20]|uniref:iron-containing alcohol dehydrogenase family protein n=1 Tax=Pseudaeromonas aegiceratis TaxID=3153928 RepID=UPI00390C7FC3